MKHIINKNQPLSNELCEFIGAIIGDGFTNCYQNHYITQLTGHRTLDYDYYAKHLIPKTRKIFKIPEKIYQKNNWIRINYFSKDLFQMLTQRFKLPKGKKGNKLLIPKEIINSKKEFISKTLRGIYDTDGYFYYDQRKIYKNPYPTIDLHMKSLNLLKQIQEVLKKFQIKSSIREKQSHLLIYGKKEVDKFLKEINFKNTRHSKKFL